MILQSLAQYYDSLAARGEIVPEGWSSAKVAFALDLDGEGRVTGLFRQEKEEQRGKKTVLRPRVLAVPQQKDHTVGIAANFLCDTATYLLGADGKGKPARARKCFEASAACHLTLLDGVDSPAARAVRAFYENWKPGDAHTNPVLAEQWDALMQGGNLVFWVNGRLAQDDPAVRQAWASAQRSESGAPPGRCLVTGEKAPIAQLHGIVHGVRGAQPSGAKLVSFHAPAFESYGKTQSYNAPVGERAAFAYTTALSHLLADGRHTALLGDTTVVCWAEHAEPVYQDVFASLLDERGLLEDVLRDVLRCMEEGRPPAFGSVPLDADEPFYVLGLSPNAARLSVRFFYRQSFGGLLRHFKEHFDRLEIVRPSYDAREALSVWSLLRETVNEKARVKAPAPLLAGAVMRAVLTGGRYPAALLNGALLRIRAEQKVTRGRAAIIKAYYLKNGAQDAPEEVFSVTLNETTTYQPYLLGRLFSVLEELQQRANPGGLNATIRDRYFNSAAATPAAVFPILLKLSNAHLRKLEKGAQVNFQKQIQEITGRITESYPARHTLEQQGVFQLGYYHQTQKRYEKKED